MVVCSIYKDMAELLRYRNDSQADRKLMRCIHAASENRNLPDVALLLQFCGEIQLDFFRTLALILKGEWERYFETEDDVTDDTIMHRLAYLLPTDRFSPDTKKIFELFETHGQLASRSGYSRESFNVLIRGMVLAQLHMAANNSSEIRFFAECARNRLGLLGSSSPETEQAFWGAKIQWLCLQEELGDKLLLVESRRLKNAQIHREWMLLLGDVHVSLEEQTLRLELLQLKMQFIDAEPNLSSEALAEMVQGIASEMEKKVNDLRAELAMVGCRQQVKTGQTLGADEFDQYLATCKKLLRQIWMLIHPDHIAHHASYGKLTPEQKHSIQELWHRVLRVRPEELGFHEGQIGNNYRSDRVLRDILRKARSILQYAGIDMDTELIIEGQTLDEQLAWLEDANTRLNVQICNATAELKALIEDAAVSNKEALLTCNPERQETIRDAILRKSADIKRKADQLEKELAAVMDRNSKSN